VYSLCVFSLCLTLPPILNLCAVGTNDDVEEAEDVEEEDVATFSSRFRFLAFATLATSFFASSLSSSNKDS